MAVVESSNGSSSNYKCNHGLRVEQLLHSIITDVTTSFTQGTKNTRVVKLPITVNHKILVYCKFSENG